MITKALIENFRETVKPFVSQILFGTNYEDMGTLDCVEFERDFDEILDLALAGYEQKVNNAISTLDGNKNDMVYRQQAIDAVRASYDEILDFKSTGRTVADSVEDILSELPAAKSEYYWRQFKTRPLTEEEKEMHPDIDLILDCDLPKNGQKILITVNEPGHEPVQTDVFCDDGECSLDSLYEIGTEATAWMPSPEPYKGGAK